MSEEKTVYPSHLRVDEKKKIIYAGPVAIGRVVDGGIQFFDRDKRRASVHGEPVVPFRDIRSFTDKQAGAQQAKSEE